MLSIRSWSFWRPHRASSGLCSPDPRCFDPVLRNSTPKTHVQVVRYFRARSALPPGVASLVVRRTTTYRREAKTTKFHPERHLPQLKQTATSSQPIPNPLVELLQSAITTSTPLEDLARSSLSFDFGLSPKALGDTLFGSKQSSKPVRSLVDGPIRARPKSEEELLFHPLDEVSVIDPARFLAENRHLANYTAITNEEFGAVASRLGLGDSNGIVASISGGPDSMAMAILLAQYCTDQNIPLLCVTIDHALRPEAPAEALVTQGWLHSRGIPHVIVRVEWPDSIPTHGIQSKARDARYEAITRVAHELQMRLSSPTSTALVHVLMAHTADDNIETFCLRMAGCSGSYGLAGIAETRKLDKRLLLVRPLLEFAKNRLYATLIAENQPWASDPSNAKLLYKRNQVRHTLEEIYSKTAPLPRIGQLAAEKKRPEDSEDISLADLQSLQMHFTKARFIMDSVTHRFCADYVGVSHKYGYAVIPTLAFLHLPEIFALRILDTVLAHVSGPGTPTRLKSLRACLKQIQEVSALIDDDPELEQARENDPGRLTSTRDSFQKNTSQTGNPKKETLSATQNRPICIHHCIIVQTRHKLTVTMQNVPSAPAILCGDRKPLPPYRADTEVKLGSVMHWLDSWRITYHLKPAITRPGEAISELPSELYIRQVQPSDLPILRRIPSWNALQKKLTKETLMALPIVVDQSSRLVYCSFIDGLVELPDGKGLALASKRKAVKALATVLIEFLPKRSMTEPPASTFVGYSKLTELELGNMPL